MTKHGAGVLEKLFIIRFSESIGGWTIKPKSCNRGFKSLPSIGIDIFLSKGLEVKIKNAKKPKFKKPMIDKNFALKSESKDLL